MSCMPKPLLRLSTTTGAALLPGEQQAVAARRPPGDAELTGGRRQRAVLHGVGGELVQGHGEDRGALRRQENIRPLDQDPWPTLALIGLKLALDHGLEARAGPLRLEQKIMGAMQRAQSLRQGLGHGLCRPVGGLAQARLHQRLHDGEHVLDPVIELADQHGLALRCASPLGHVTEDQHGAGDRTVEAENRRAGILDGQLLARRG